MSRRSFASIVLEKDPELRNAVASSGLFAKLRNGLKKVQIGGQTYFVAEGDTLLDEDQLQVYAFSREKVNDARRAGDVASGAGVGVTGLSEVQALVAHTQSGKIVRWRPGLVLTYRVVKNTFTNPANYTLVVDAMREATTAWEKTCGTKFEHRVALDPAPGVDPAGALFAVRELDTGGTFIAAAFFPNDPMDRRHVLIDPSFYAPNLGFNRVGVLRHELGHVLGFRHEHIRSNAPPACPDEPLFDTANITEYDPQSVMHYFCGGVGSRELKITAVDRIGSRQVYGPPLDEVLLVDA